MKKIILILVSILLLLVLLFYVYKLNIQHNIKKREMKLESVWKKIFQNSSDRVELLSRLASPIRLDKFEDSFGLKKNVLDLHNNKTYKECTPEFKEREYLLNNIYLRLLIQLKQDSLANKQKGNILIELHRNDTLFNSVISYYNDLVTDYNKYISLFPNFIFAKQKGYTRWKHFEIKLGRQNEDPKKIEKELPEWAKGIDTL